MINFTFDIRNIGIIVLLSTTIFFIVLLILSCNSKSKPILKDRETETEPVGIVDYDPYGYPHINQHYIQYI